MNEMKTQTVSQLLILQIILINSFQRHHHRWTDQTPIDQAVGQKLAIS